MVKSMPHSAGCGVEGDTVIYRTDSMPFPGIALSYCGVIRLDAEGVELCVRITRGMRTWGRMVS